MKINIQFDILYGDSHKIETVYFSLFTIALSPVFPIRFDASMSFNLTQIFLVQRQPCKNNIQLLFKRSNVSSILLSHGCIYNTPKLI